MTLATLGTTYGKRVKNTRNTCTLHASLQQDQPSGEFALHLDGVPVPDALGLQHLDRDEHQRLCVIDSGIQKHTQVLRWLSYAMCWTPVYPDANLLKLKQFQVL